MITFEDANWDSYSSVVSGSVSANCDDCGGELDIDESYLTVEVEVEKDVPVSLYALEEELKGVLEQSIRDGEVEDAFCDPDNDNEFLCSVCHHDRVSGEDAEGRLLPIIPPSIASKF